MYRSKRTEDNILMIVGILKKKPKYKALIHYGDEGYSREELNIVFCLNFEIQVCTI